MNDELFSYLGKGEVYALNMGIRYERERIIRLLQEPYWHNLRSPDIHEDCKMCETIWLINDINIL
jgi:hypothetical protein